MLNVPPAYAYVYVGRLRPVALWRSRAEPNATRPCRINGR